MKRTITISVLLLFTFAVFSQKRIKMQNDGGIYTVPCVVNGLNLRFIFDTGASSVSISSAEATFMFKNGYLDSSDIVGSGKAKIADGSLIENTHIILRELEIAGMKLTNVDAVVVNNIDAPLLLGQSAIQKLGKVQLDGDELVILEQDDLLINERVEKTQQLVNEAFNYYEQESYLRSYDKFTEAYNLGADFFTFIDYSVFSSVSKEIGEYEIALKYLDKANSMKEELSEDDWKQLASIYNKYYDIYSELKQHKKALLYINEVISIREANIIDKSSWKSISTSYLFKGFTYINITDWRNALESFHRANVAWFCANTSFCDNTSNNDEYDNLIKKINKGTFKNKDLGIIYYYLSLCYQQLGNSDDGIRCLRLSSNVGNNLATRYLKQISNE